MFTEYANTHSQPTPWEYGYAMTLNTAGVGMPLKVSAGKLVACTGTSKPEYLLMAEKNSIGTGTVPVIPVAAGKKYRCVATEAIAEPAMGTKYTISADGEGITATTASGVAELVGWDKAPIQPGDIVTVKF